jgi:ketosteroid isomerase-like protein
MSQENVELVRDALIAASDGDPLAALPMFDPASEWDMSGVSAWPEKQLYRGLQEIGTFLRTWRGAFAEWHFDVEEVRAAGDEHVYAAIHEWGIGAGSGAGVDQHRYALLSVLEGRITSLHMFSDRAEALRAAGLPE